MEITYLHTGMLQFNVNAEQRKKCVKLKIIAILKQDI